jgi:hypothetical protein
MRAPGSLPVARLVWTKCERHRGAVRSLSQCAISDRRSLVRAGCCLSSRAGCRKRRRRSPPPGEARHKSGCRRTGSRRSRAERQRRSAGTRSASVSETHSSSEGGRGRLADGLEHERGHDAEARLGRPAERPEEISAGIDDLADGEQGLGAARSEPESGPCIRPRIPSPFPGLSPPLLGPPRAIACNASPTPAQRRDRRLRSLCRRRDQRPHRDDAPTPGRSSRWPSPRASRPVTSTTTAGRPSPS